MAVPNRMNFRKSPKEGGGSFPIQNFMSQILETLDRAFWAWKRYKRVFSGFRLCFFCNRERRKIKTLHTLKEAFQGSGHATKLDYFSERSQTAVDPTPSRRIHASPRCSQTLKNLLRCCRTRRSPGQFCSGLASKSHCFQATDSSLCLSARRRFLSCSSTIWTLQC